MIAEEIKEVVAKAFLKKRMCVHFEVGLCRGGRLRADVIALSMRGELTVVEVKSSVADFKADKKWQSYLDYANKFYFAMTEAVYAKVKASIPKQVGVFVIYDRPWGRHTRPAVRVERKTRRCEIDPLVRENLIIRMAFRSADHSMYSRRKKRA